MATGRLGPHAAINGVVCSKGWGGVSTSTCADQEGAGVFGHAHWETHRAIGFLKKTAPEHLENDYAAQPAFIVGPSSATKWRFAGEPMMARF